MNIQTIIKTTLLDFPNHLACTVFLNGCNFICPYCQNAGLVLENSTDPLISEHDFFEYLKKRKNILEGVCITGGEPTLQPDLYEFITKIKSLDLLVKLDTNGYNPHVLEKLIQSSLIDYIAMDIKNSPKKYSETVGIPNIDISVLQKSIHIMIHSNINYEFRTTVTKESHSMADFMEIADLIKGAHTYYLQAYSNHGDLIEDRFSSYTLSELETFRDYLLKYIPTVQIRGIE